MSPYRVIRAGAVNFRRSYYPIATYHECLKAL
jgi:hypothetical protein